MMTSAKNPPNSIVIYGYDNLTHVPSLMPHLPFALQVSSYFQWSAQQAPVGSLPPLNPQCPVTHVRVDLGVELVDGTVGSSSYPAQEFPKLEYDLHALRLMRIAEYKQAVYINPMAKLHLQDTYDNLLPLVDKVKGHSHQRHPKQACVCERRIRLVEELTFFLLTAEFPSMVPIRELCGCMMQYLKRLYQLLFAETILSRS